MIEFDHLASDQSDEPNVTTNPFEAPKADFNPAARAGRVRPSVGMVVALTITQLALTAGIGMLSVMLLRKKPWMGTLPSGVLVGAVLFGAVMPSIRPGSGRRGFKIQLALWSALVWVPLGGAIFAIFSRNATVRNMPQLWLSATLAIAGLTLFQFAITLLGLALASWFKSEAPG